ncbi:hypothetical protein SmJEL517_g05884 [Synchytrium microbalum]|uniref:Uncharacterized protein n=1 Tax=Synchytrium microbalum TaxID=1806994 RepID=A0A507BIR3_9FUNG|nr:uncharacterized protein SmJEL517_g05884 [Synchytrium microbalum]TPX30580.1 hypothetical protein SmJEL517_g05884 [Synchytrium microbalum]
MKTFIFIIHLVSYSMTFISAQQNSTTTVCKSGTRIAAFVVSQPNSSTIVAVGGHATVAWSYSPPAWATKRPQRVSIYINRVATGVDLVFDDPVVTDLDVTNNATVYDWFPVQSLIDGNYKIRIAGDGKDTQKGGQPNRDVCFADGEVVPANSAQFVVVNPPYLQPVANPLPAFSSAPQRNEINVALVLVLGTAVSLNKILTFCDREARPNKSYRIAETMQAAVETILQEHGVLEEFRMLPSDLTEEDGAWTIEIRAAESSSFSQPLAISRLGDILTLAHFSPEVWDVVYEPLMEYSLQSEPWRPLCIERHYEGHRRLEDGEITIEELEKFDREWASRLIERGYHDTSVSHVKRVSVPKRDSVKSKL